MTTGQLELPLFTRTRSTADDPAPEQERTHPAQMIIQHCGNPKDHASHADELPMPWGCPGVPDVRDEPYVYIRGRKVRVEDVELP
jgi:hypothetical protein